MGKIYRGRCHYDNNSKDYHTELINVDIKFSNRSHGLYSSLRHFYLFVGPIIMKMARLHGVKFFHVK